MTDICLALMPYGNLPRPSLALSLLKAYLAETDVRVKVTYPNFLFAQEIGAQLYMALGSRSGAYQVGEWTFARAAFPDFKSDDDEYLAGMDAILPDDGFMTEALAGRSIKDLLPELREKTTTFVNRTAQSILDLKPRIVGCSSTGQQRCASLALLRRIRELDPRVITLMGGANCEGPMGVVTRREFPWVDFVVSGEADGFFTDFCRMLLEYGRDVPIDELPYGVIGPHFFFGNDPRPAPRATFHDMNTQPFPDFDDYFQALHKSGFDLDPELVVETSRGCWWGEKSHCTFCGLNGTVIKFRSKSPERVLDELKFLSERYRMRSFDVVDCIVDLGYVKTLFPKLADLGGPYSIFYETKGNLTREHLELFKAAGIHYIQPGLESLHDKVLELIGKGTTAVINVQLLKWAKEVGIRLLWNHLTDVPGERDEWYYEMARWTPLIFHLQPPAFLLSIQFLRFSPYHMRPEDFGLKLSPAKWYSYIYPLSSESMIDFAYEFEDQTRPASGDGPARRAGAQKLEETIVAWRRLHREDAQPPVLEMMQDGDRLFIKDTRPCAVAHRHVLEGLASRLYLLCDQARSTRTISRVLKLEWDEIRPVAEDLEARGLLLTLNATYLSLAVRSTGDSRHPRKSTDRETSR